MALLVLAKLELGATKALWQNPGDSSGEQLSVFSHLCACWRRREWVRSVNLRDLVAETLAFCRWPQSNVLLAHSRFLSICT